MIERRKLAAIIFAMQIYNVNMTFAPTITVATHVSFGLH